MHVRWTRGHLHACVESTHVLIVRTKREYTNSLLVNSGRNRYDAVVSGLGDRLVPMVSSIHPAATDILRMVKFLDTRKKMLKVACPSTGGPGVLEAAKGWSGQVT